MWIETKYGLFNTDRADYIGVEKDGTSYNLVMGIRADDNNVRYKVLESDVDSSRIRADYIKVRKALSHVVSLRHTEALV